MVIVGAAVVATAGAAVRVTAHLANVALEATGQWSGVVVAAVDVERCQLLWSYGLKRNPSGGVLDHSPKNKRGQPCSPLQCCRHFFPDKQLQEATVPIWAVLLRWRMSCR